MANKITIQESGDFTIIVPPKDGIKRTVNVDVVHNKGRFKITADDGSYTHTSISSITVQNQGATIEAMPFDLNDINVFGSEYIYAGTIFPMANDTSKFARVTKDADGNIIVGLENNPAVGVCEFLTSTNIYGDTVPIMKFEGRLLEDNNSCYVENFFRDKNNITFDELFNSCKDGYGNYKSGTLIFSFYIDDPATDRSDSKTPMIFYRGTDGNSTSKIALDNIGMPIDAGTWYSIIISSDEFFDDGGYGYVNHYYGKIINETTGDEADVKFDGSTFVYWGAKIWIGGVEDTDGNDKIIRYSQIRFFREHLEPELAREISLRQLPTTTGE